MRKISIVSNLVVALLASQSFAQSKLSFAAILQNLSAKSNVSAELPNADRLYAAKTIDEAGQIVKSMDYSAIATQKKSVISATESAGYESILRRKQLTLVIVPGLLGEFIDTRAFEDLFSKETSYKKTWQQIATRSGLTDQRLNLEKYAYENIPLSEEISAASIDDKNGQPLVKVIIFNAKLGSLESIGDNTSRAAAFNRRLEKYVQLTNDQNLVMIGYSRGTPLALEMVTQAQAQNLNYLSRVQSLVSYAGVVMGSALADVTADLSTSNGKMFAAAQKYSNSLQYDKGFTGISSLWTKSALQINTEALAEFTATALQNAPPPDLQGNLNSAKKGDFGSITTLIQSVLVDLGVKAVNDFNGHVSRVKTFINAMLTAVGELRSENRAAWWKTHTLPKTINYYSLSAVMVDQNHSALEKLIFNAKEGYNDTLDDAGLLQNMHDYEKASGFALNDSQVALHQSQFLPNVIAGLNANNKDMKIQSLGILQTHHWGASLRVVNAMKDGRMNPFPREQVLTGLAIYLNQ